MPNFFLQHFKNKIVQFCELYGSKKRYDKKFFFTPGFHCCFWIRDPGSGIRDPGSVIRDPGWVKSRSGINIPDPQHRTWVSISTKRKQNFNFSVTNINKMSSLSQSNCIKCKFSVDSLGINDKWAWKNPFSVIITGFYSIIKCRVDCWFADFEKQIKCFYI